MRLQIVEQIAEPGGLAEHGRRRLRDLAEPAHQAGAALQPDQRIVLRDLEGGGQRRRIDLRQPLGIRAQRLVRRRGKAAAREQVEAGHAQPLGAAQAQVAGRIAVAPVRPGARVEQHAGNHQVDADARALLAMIVAGQRGAFAQDAPAVAQLARSAAFEMAPAAVVRHLQIAVARADGGRHIVGDRGDPLRMPAEPLRIAGRDRGGHRGAARPHRLRRQQRRSWVIGFDPALPAFARSAGLHAGLPGRAHRCCIVSFCHSSSPLPLATVSSVASGGV